MKSNIKAIINTKFFLVFLFLVLSILSVYPAFAGHFFKLTMDGKIHLVRFEPIAESFRHMELPPMVNFLGFGNIGEVFTSTYPWISELIFIIPLAIFKNPISAMKIGFTLLNFLTMLNAYLLAKKLTRKPVIQLIGIFIYQFNSYHMIVLFARNAIGEGMAYAFLPLILLGWIEIFEHNTRIGVVIFSFGLGMVINSHIITAFYACFFIVIGFIFNLLCRKIDKRIIKGLTYSVFLTLTVSIFTIGNLLTILLNNKIATPNKGFATVQFANVINDSLNNYITDQPGDWNIGLISLFLLIFLFIKSICTRRKESWKICIDIAMVIFVFTLSWVSAIDNHLGKTIFGNIQFGSRLLSFVMVFLDAAIILYLNTYSEKYNFNNIALIICAGTFCLSILGVRTFHYIKKDDPIRYYLTQNNYNDTINKPNYGWGDYVLVNSKNKPLLNLNNHKLKDISKVTYNRIEYSFYSKGKERYKIPLLFYKGINYTINNLKLKKERGIVTVITKKGNNSLTISSRPSTANYLLFTISIIAILVLSLIIAMVM